MLLSAWWVGSAFGRLHDERITGVSLRSVAWGCLNTSICEGSIGYVRARSVIPYLRLCVRSVVGTGPVPHICAHTQARQRLVSISNHSLFDLAALNPASASLSGRYMISGVCVPRLGVQHYSAPA